MRAAPTANTLLGFLAAAFLFCGVLIGSYATRTPPAFHAVAASSAWPSSS
jgi:hypothetical protein